MQLICEGHPQITGVSHGIRLVLNKPTVLEEPVLQGDSTADALGCSIYGSVIDDGGTFRMWYQAWPRDWDGSDEVSVACAESDDGVNWRRPSCGLVECSGGKQNPSPIWLSIVPRSSSIHTAAWRSAIGLSDTRRRRS